MQAQITSTSSLSRRKSGAASTCSSVSARSARWRAARSTSPRNTSRCKCSCPGFWRRLLPPSSHWFARKARCYWRRKHPQLAQALSPTPVQVSTIKSNTLLVVSGHCQTPLDKLYVLPERYPEQKFCSRVGGQHGEAHGKSCRDDQAHGGAPGDSGSLAAWAVSDCAAQWCPIMGSALSAQRQVTQAHAWALSRHRPEIGPSAGHQSPACC